MSKKLLLCAALTLTTAPVMAQQFGVNAKVSTLGLGVEARYNFSERFGVSAGLYGFNRSRTEVRSGIRYNTKLKLRHAPILAHYYPMLNGFRLSGGIVINGTKANGVAINRGTIDLDGTPFTGAELQSVHAKVDFRKVAPYLGVGWDSGDRTKSGFSFTADLGVMFTGKPKVSLTPNCGTAGCIPLVVNRANAERANLQATVNKYKVYPVVSIGAMYRF